VRRTAVPGLLRWPLLLVVTVTQAACLWAASPSAPPSAGATRTPPAERFRVVDIVAPSCPSTLPIKVDGVGHIVQPADAAYGATLPRLCYATAADAQQDGYTPSPPGQRAALSPTGVAGTPVSVQAAATALFGKLERTPITAAELPSGSTDPRASRGASVQAANAAVPGLIGEIDVALTGPDDRDGIAYLVFPADGAAAHAFASQSAGQAARDVVSFAPSGIGYPTRCISAAVPQAGGPALGTTICYVRIGYVEVVGLSARADPSGRTPQGDPEQAIALARAGVQHLLRVLRQS